MKHLISSEELRLFTLKIGIVLVIGLCLWLAFSLSSIIMLFLGAIFVALLMSPFVAHFHKWHIGRWRVPDFLAIIMTFSSLILFLTLFIIAIIPIFVDLATNIRAGISRGIDAVQVQARADFPLLDTLPFGAGDFVRDTIDTRTLSQVVLSQEKSTIIADNILGNLDSIQNFAKQGIGQVGTIGISFASSVSSTLIFAVLFMIVTFFVLLERRNLLLWFSRTLPDNLSLYLRHRQSAIGDAVHSWLKGQLRLAGLMFLLNLTGLSIMAFFGVPLQNIFALALIAGVMEFVPYAGPILSWFPAFLMVVVSPESTGVDMVAISILYMCFQFIEGNIMVPWVMSKTMNLSPLYILLMTLIGATLGGIVGVLISVPLASILHIFYRDWMHYRSEQRSSGAAG